MPSSLKKYYSEEEYRKVRYEQRKRYYNKHRSYSPRRLWTPLEDSLVINHTISDVELSKKIDRSVAAIQMRRYLLRRGLV